MAYLYKRGKVYWVGYKQNGKEIRKSLKVTSKDAAKTLFNEYWTLEAREANNSKALIIQRSFEDTIKDYHEIDKIGKSRHTIKEKKSALKRFTDYLADGVVRLEDITTDIIERYFISRLDQSISGANKDLKVIKHFLKYAIQRGYLYSNPATPIKKIKTVKKIFRNLSFEEIDKLLKVAQKKYPALYPLVAAGYYLGLRREELVFLEWNDIDFDGNIVHVRSKPENRVKDNEERSVPLNSKLRKILKALPRRGRFAFLTPSGTTWKNNVYREFQKIVKAAGLENVTIQTLRETFGSHLLKKGVSIYLVSKYLGHSSVDVTTRHYAYIPIEMTHKEIDLL